MTVKWIDAKNPDQATRDGWMHDDIRMPNEERTKYAHALADSLIGLTLAEAESRISSLDAGYHAYLFTTGRDGEYDFRLSKAKSHGWDAVSFKIGANGRIGGTAVG